MDDRTVRNKFLRYVAKLSSKFQTRALYQSENLYILFCCYTQFTTDGETTGGGFPGWVGNIAGSLRTDNANYTQGTQIE